MKCIICGKEFKPYSSRCLVCSPQCRAERTHQKTVERNHGYRERDRLAEQDALLDELLLVYGQQGKAAVLDRYKVKRYNKAK